MLYAQTYDQALAAPTGKGGKGWKYADAASTQAAMAQALGIQHCLAAKAIFDWANRHHVGLFAERKRLMVADVLLIATLNNWNLDYTEKKMKG